MILRKEGRNLIQAGMLKMLARDQWSITATVTGLELTGEVDAKGNSEARQVMFDLVFSHDEIAALARYARGAPRA